MPVSGGGYRKYDPKRLKQLLAEPASTPESHEQWNKVTNNELSKNLGRDLIGRARDRRVPPVKTKEKPLSKRKLISIAKQLGEEADLLGIQWCLIGGAAFKLNGIPYSTADIDVSALKRLEPDTFERYPGRPVNNNDNGHYLIRGVKVDWMYRLDDGSGPLFKAAVKNCYWYHPESGDIYGLRNAVLEGGIPIATPEYGMAIKVNAGREKDIAVFMDLVRKGYVDAQKTLELIHRYVK